MADLILERPESGQRVEYGDLNSDARVVLGFPAEDAVLERQGDSLIFTFEDNSSIELNDFYNAFTSENLPEFSIDGQVVSGEEFFAALGDETLMPAAGPAQQTADGNRFHEYGNSSLLSGIDRLDGLDLGWDREVDPDRDLFGGGRGSDETMRFGAELFTLNISVDNLYEDGRPMQNIYGNDPDQPQTYGQLHFDFTGNEWTVVDAIELSGLHAGTVIYFGDPNDPNTEFITIGEDGKLLLTPDQVANGVYFKPPTNSDVDMDITTRVQITSTSNNETTWVDGPSFTIVVDAVADLPYDLSAQPGYLDDGYSHAAPGSEITLKVTVSFEDYLDGSESHYLLAELLPGWTNSGGYETVEMDGKTYLKVPVDNADIANGDGTITVDVTVTTPDATQDTDYNIKVYAVAEENATDGELDLDNNIAMTETEITVSVDAITGNVVLNLGMLQNLYEDGQPWQYTDEHGNKIVGQNGDANRDYQPGFDPVLGVQIFLPDADGNYLQGGSDGEYISSITFSNLPDASQGTLFYNGVPVAEGQTIDNPDMSLFTFKPGDNWSGDLSFDFQVDISSTDSGQTVSRDPETVDVHVDSVADLADADAHDLVQEVDADGNYAIQADDGEARTNDAGEKEGWYDSFADNQTPVTATLTISFQLYDLDGSENASILIPVSDDIKLLEDINGNPPQLVTIDGVDYWVYATGEASDLQALLEANGGTFDLKVSVSPDANNDSVKVYVRTEETGDSPNNQTDNDAAMREVEHDIDLSWLSSSVTVSTGWTYEGGDGSKHMDGGSYDPDLGAIDGNSRSTVTLPDGSTVEGAPVELSFTNPEWVTEVTFTYDPAQGTLYFDGVAITGTTNPDGTVTITITNVGDLDNIVFVPSSDYGDDDINLDYTVGITDDKGNNYLVSGSTTVVVDSVADRAEVQDTSAAAADDNSSVVITVKAEFPDTDGSEKHYILIEYKDGWDCPEASGTVTVYYDAQGNVMHPVWNAETKEWEAPEGYASSQEFWQIDVSDVTNTDNPQTEFEITLTPPAGAGDTNFGTGTMAVEEPGDEEYDYNNNIAYDFKDGGTDVNVIDATIGGSATGAYEDNDANQHGGTYINDTGSGVITITIGHHDDGDFVENSGEYLDTSSGNVLTLTFDWAGEVDPGTFSIVGGDGTEYQIYWDEDLGKYRVDIPTEDFGSGNLDEIQLQYNPPANDDTDLLNINASVPVTNNDGFTQTIDGGIGDMVVDAVADKPTDVETSVKDIDGGYDKADWGSEITISVGATFYDFEDGSETHYLLIEAREGWTCSNADGVIEINGKTYFYKEVSNDDLADNNGEASFDFKMTAPAEDSGSPDVTTIGNDGKVTFETGGLAVEGDLKDKDDGSGVKVPDPQGSDGSEITTDNNVAFTPDDNGASVDFNTIGDGKGSGQAYEDHQPNQNMGNYGVANDSGVITLALTDSAESITAGKLTFTYDGDGEPGTFTYINADGDEVEIPYAFNEETGKYELTLPDEILGDSSVQIRYNPPANDSTDLTDFDFELSVSANDSKAEGTVSGSINGDGTFVVDAVADMPVDVDVPGAGSDKEVGYSLDGQEQQSAAPGGEVTIPVSVSFGDYLDGSEDHYVIIEKKAGWEPQPAELYTEITHGGKTYYALNVDNIIGAAVDSLDVDAFLAANPGGGTYQYTDPSTGVTITLTVNEDGTLGDTVNVSTDITLSVPDNATNSGETFGVGGFAHENNYSDREITTDNNKAINTEDVQVAVDVIDSSPSITMDNSNIYENLTPNAHEGKHVNAEDNQPATMNFTGLAQGETATVTLYFAAFNPDGSAVDFSGASVMLRDSNGNYILGENGEPLVVTLEGPDADGNWYTVPALTLDGDTTIEFYPGENYSDRDISVNYDTTVTDDSSGAEHTWTTRPEPTNPDDVDPNVTYDQDQGGIQVDAVAQAPDLEVGGAYGTDDDGNELTAFPNGTAEIGINANLSFPDWADGSELHYLLVEAQPGFTITTITIYGPDGQEWTFDLSDGDYWMYDGTAYVRFEIPQDIIEACGGDINVTINMDTPDNVSGSATFVVGGMSQENPDGLDGEKTRDNNQAVKVEEVEVQFEGVGSITVSTKDTGVYEGDAPHANTGDFSAVGGTEIEIHLPGSPNEVSDVTLTCDYGTIYAFPSHLSQSDIIALIEQGGDALAQYEVKPGDTLSAEDLDNSTLIYVADGTNDADDTIRVEGTVRNPNTGEEHTSGDQAGVIVDAVAQQGEGEGEKNDDGSYTITVGFDDMDGSEDHYVLIQAKPGATLDVDGKSGPYEMYYHIDPDTGEMTAYWKVPVDENDLNDNGEYEINFSYDGAGEFKYGSMGEETDLSGGELTYHNNTAVGEDGSLGQNSGGGGTTLPDDKWIPNGHGHTCPDPQGDVTNSGAYENGTPNANTGDTSVGAGDAILDFKYWTWSHHNNDGSDPATGSWCSPSYSVPSEISVTFKAGDCGFLYNGEYIFEDGTDGTVSWTVTDNGDGTYTVTISGYDQGQGEVALRPGDYSSVYDDPSTFDPDNLDQYFNNNDADFGYSWSMTGQDSQHTDHDHGNGDGTYTVSGDGTVIVDAVAQGVEEDSLAYDDGGHVYGATDGNDSTTVKLEAKVIDTDSSENCWFLIEAVPGVSVPGAETIYIDGTLYYKVPATVDANGNATADVEIIVDRGAIESGVLEAIQNPDGTTTYKLKYGAMTEEDMSQLDGELSYDNNMSFTADQEMDVNVSYVDSDIRVSTTDTYENDAATGAISVAINLDPNDHLDEFSITFDHNAGEIIYLDQNGNQLSFDDVFGQGNWSLVDNGDGTSTLTITNPDPDLLENGLTFSTDGNYSSTDTSITWEAKVTDTASKDTETFSGSQDIVIDAVAQAPDVSDPYLSTDDGTAAVSGGDAQINLTLTFEDVGTGEKHYAVMANDGDWKCNSVTIMTPNGPVTVEPTLMYDQEGNPYYAVEIQDDWLDDNGSVDVQFNVTAPEASHDTTYNVKVGGISVEDFNQPDGELTLDNNWAENIKDVEITVAVVETTEINFSFGDLIENDPSGALITLTQETKDALAANNEVLTETTFTFDVTLDGGNFNTGDVVGTIIYDGRAYQVVMGPDGKPTVAIDFGPNGYDESKEFRLIWGEVQTGPDGNVVYDSNGNPVVTNWNHTGDDLGVSADSTVKDTQSGETSSATGGADDIAWTPTADAPTDINVTDPGDAYGGGVNVTFTVSASFVDVDGSEEHYILVEALDGWSCAQSVGIYTGADGKTYFMIPVDPTDPNPEVDITVKTPSGMTDDETVTLGVGGLSKDGDDEAATLGNGSVSIDIGVVQADGVTLTMDPMLEDGTPTAMHFALENGENDSIVSIKITNLDGGTIIGPNGEVLTAPVTFEGQMLADLLAGKYSYKPGDNVSGELSVTFEATVQDDASGATKTLTGQEGKVDVTPVTDVPVDQQGSAKDPSQQAGHTATVTITLSANFVDYTGSEMHFFLVQLPAGADVPAGWVEVTDPDLLSASGMSSPVYVVEANGNGQASFDITVPENYDGGDLTYKAGSYEKDVTPPQYEFSDADTVEVGATGDLNYDPNADDSSAAVADALRDPDEGASGKVDMTDADGDTVTVSEVTYTNEDGIVTTGTAKTIDGVDYIEVAGKYGTLLINVETGEYTYTLFDGANPPHGYQENFSITVYDTHGGTDGASINISINAENADPTAVDPNLSAGGVNEDQLASVTGTLDLRDADGDPVTLTGISGGQSAAVWDDATQTWTIQGKYGTLTIDTQGNYEYVLTDEHAQGKEEFSFTFQDPYGGTGEQTFTINVDYVNHAPEIDDQQAYFNESSGSYISGKIAFSDPDTAHQGDNVVIAYVVFNGVPYEIGTGYTAIETEWGTLNIRADGSYVFNPNDDASTADEWLNFTVGVKDEGGLTNEGTFSIGLGDADPAELEGLSAGLDIDPASALAGVEAIVADDDQSLLGSDAGEDLMYGDHGGETLWTAAASPDAATELYGEGTDILLFSSGASVNGGTGVDFLVGVEDFESLDGLLGTVITDVEVIVKGGEGLTSLTDLGDVGITVTDGNVSLDSSWSQGEQLAGDAFADYSVYHNDDADLTILVQKTALEQGQG